MQTPAMNPSALLAIVQRRKWSILLPALAAMLITVIIVLVLPPVYRSTATILIEQQDIPEDFVKTTITTYADQQLQIINQRVMTATRLLEIVNRYDLYHDLRDKKTTEEIVAAMRDDIKLTPISVDVLDRRTGRPVTATIAFTLSYAGKNSPLKVQQIANVLTSLYLEENMHIREQQAGNVSKFLETEMRKVKTDLDEADRRISDFKKAHAEELPEMMQVNLQSLNNLERDRDTLRERLTNLKERGESLRTQLSSVSPSQRRLDKDRLEELRTQLVSLRNQFSEEYPEVIRTRNEIARLEKKLGEPENHMTSKDQAPDNPAFITLSSELAGVKSEISSVQTQLSDLDNKIAAYRSRITTTSRIEAEYAVLLGEKNNIQAKHDDLMRKAMEARVSQGLEEGQKGERFTLIEPARLPEKPFKPNRMALLIIGIVLGTGLGFGTGFLREILDRTIKGPEDLTGFGIPLLAIVPSILIAEDRARAKRRMLLVLAGLAGMGLTAVIMFHVWVMPLDMLATLIIKRMGW